MAPSNASAFLVVSDAGAGVPRRYSITPGLSVTVGRGAPAPSPTPDVIRVPAERAVSRRQVVIQLEADRLRVARLPGAQPVIFRGAACEEFVMEPGDVFKVAETRFCFLIDRSTHGAADREQPLNTYSVPQGLTLAERPQAAQLCLRALVEMPAVLKLDLDTGQTLAKIAEMLGRILGSAMQVSAWRATESSADGSRVDLVPLNADAAARAEPPSRRLAAIALAQPDSVHVHDWGASETSTPAITRPDPQVRWSILAPTVLARTERYLLYIAGTSPVRTRSDVQELQQLVSAVTRHYLLAARAQRLRGQVGQFFSPAVRALLLQPGSSGSSTATGISASALERRKCDATVMFFDLRGFSRAGEVVEDQDVPDEEVDRRLLAHHALLERVLGTVANEIFETGGIVVDFQGDAALACWGAPISVTDHAERAARAARAIVERISDMALPFGGSEQLRCGIGITSGPLVAGRFHASPDGTSEGLVKYSVMGTTVNQASRLEGLTKKIGVPVLMSGSVHRLLEPGEPPRRYVARVLPAGMKRPVDIYELVLPAEIGGTGVTPEGISQYETALAHFIAGRLDEARRSLRHACLRGDDRVVEFLERHVIDLRPRGVPADFDGVLAFDAK